MPAFRCWASATAVTDSVRLPWSRHFLPLAPSVRGAWDFEPDTPPPPAHVVPLRLVYAMYCDATVTRLPSGDPVEVGSLTLTEDADGLDIDVSLNAAASSTTRFTEIPREPGAMVTLAPESPSISGAVN